VTKTKRFDSMRLLSHLIRKKARLETGFSMLEAVVVVGVLLAIAVGGFFAYGPIVTNAKVAKIKSIASEVYTAVAASVIDGDPSTSPQGVIDSFNATSPNIRFEIRSATETPVVAAMSTENYTPTSDGDFCIKAIDTKNPEINAESGNCPAPPATPSPDPADDSVTPVEEIPAPPVAVSLLKNGDFSDSLNHWTIPTVGVFGGRGVGDAPKVTSGEAVLTPRDYKWDAIRQTVNVPNGGISYLQYSYRIYSVSNSTCAASYLAVNVYDSSGNLLKRLGTHCNAIFGTSTNTLGAAEFTEFAGQNVQIEFMHVNNHFDATRTARQCDQLQPEGIAHRRSPR
jgi:type II secretory pathway pseudopilin PulG